MRQRRFGIFAAACGYLSAFERQVASFFSAFHFPRCEPKWNVITS